MMKHEDGYALNANATALEVSGSQARLVLRGRALSLGQLGSFAFSKFQLLRQAR